MEDQKLKILDVTFVKTNSEKVKARADVHFDGFLLKGFKIVQDENTKKEFVTPPSYKSPKGWRATFKTDNVADWQKIQQEILQRFMEAEIKESIDENYEEN